MSSAGGGARQRVAVGRGRGTFVNRTSRNAGARRILQTRTGRGAGGRFTVRQLREAIANRGAGRRRTL